MICIPNTTYLWTNFWLLLLSLLFQTSLPCCVFACVVSGTSFCCCYFRQGNTSDDDNELREDTQHNSTVCSCHTRCTYPSSCFCHSLPSQNEGISLHDRCRRMIPKSLFIGCFLNRWRPRNWFWERWQGRQSIGFCRCQCINSGWHLSCLIVVVCLHDCQCSFFRYPITGVYVFK